MKREKLERKVREKQRASNKISVQKYYEKNRLEILKKKKEIYQEKKQLSKNVA